MKKVDATIVVVLAITVVGCCTIWTMKTKESAAQTQCLNNLKFIGLAVHSFHDSNRKLPRAIASTPKAEFPPEKQASWLWLISPYIEARMDPKFKIDPDKPWDHPENAYVGTSSFLVYQCPANPNTGPNVNFTHYVGIAGVGKDAAWLPLVNTKAGVFGYERTLTLKDIEKADGHSTTMMVAETARENGPWAMGGFTTARGIDVEEPAYLSADGPFGSHHGSWFRSTSITQVVMVDGSVRKFTSNVSDQVFESLATYAGGEKIADADLDR